MKAMIFAAGLGTRLKPFTLEHPKALAPVRGVPMLGRVINKIKAYGITEMVVNVHHFASQITDYLRANDNFGITIHVSDETDLLLDTGGGILAARRWLDDDDFIVHNADILTDLPLAPMIERHKSARALATLLVAARDTSRYLLFDPEMRMHGWANKNTGEVRPAGIDASAFATLAFGGVHILSPRVFDTLSAFAADRRVFSVIDYYISACTSDTIIGHLPSERYTWLDIGRPDSLAAAQSIVFKN